MLITNPSEAASIESPWQQCLARIREKVGPHTYETWFRATDMSSDGNGTVRIQVPNRFFADFIEEHFAPVIGETLKEMGIPVTELLFDPTERDWNIIKPIQEEFRKAEMAKVAPSAEQRGQFHPNYIFDKFVVGDGNRMAHAAALAVAEAPGKTTFNPLVIYGGTGLGKTHLLQAIGHFAYQENTADKVVYITSEEFTNRYISYVIDKKDSTSFYKDFGDVDLLLLDDIHFFSGKHGTQKEFFRIFNRLMMENKQIVLSSDRPPEKIPDMMHHIINRFMGGLIADIQPPNLETRMAILRKKAEIDGLYLPAEVIEYIAGHITSNVRELEGTLIKLIASSSFTGRDITLQVAQELCGDALAGRQQRLSVTEIQTKVAGEFGVTRNQITAHSRKKDVVIPRCIAMFLCKKWTRQSLRSIGLEFGGRDYSTVIHAAKRVESLMQNDSELRDRVQKLERMLEE